METKTPVQVAPEFIEALQENAFVTLKHCLEKMGAPESVKTLANSLFDLAYYRLEAGESEIDFSVKGFDIQGLIVKTVNSIVEVGGTFDGGETTGIPRKGTMLDNFKDPFLAQDGELPNIPEV